MKRILFLITFLFFISFNSWAKHEKGGWVLYEYVGAGTTANTSIYKITVYVFYSCTATGPRGVDVGIYDGVTNSLISKKSFQTETAEGSVNKTTFSPCLSPKPTAGTGNTCYLIDTYEETVTLNNNSNGYLIGVNTSGHRVDNLMNIVNSGNTSLAMWARIPGTINGVDYHTNSSPVFLFKDTVIICYGGYFEYQFTAVDNIDHDSLYYSFGNGHDGASVSTPPYPSVTYSSPYSAKFPLGSKVTIDESTGLISGIAPVSTGEYIIDVYVKEWRNGILIDSIKKELQIDVNDCTLLSAELQKVYVNCDSFTLSFQNLSTASNITNYVWNFGDTLSASNTSGIPVVSHTFTKAGDYTLSLHVSNNDGCNNTATAKVKVYPGFTPSFKTIGSCYQSPIEFLNTTYAKYGIVNSWEWNFGDPRFAATADSNVSYLANPSHYYGKPQTATVIMQVGSSVGCFGSDTMQVVINDKPYISLFPQTDTVICDKDSLKIIAQTTATIFSWSPQINMIDSTTLTPIVFPKTNTVYTLTAKQGGCVDTASVKVNAVHYITVSFNPDTIHACKKDSILMKPKTLASSFLWTESGSVKTLNDYSISTPKASPNDDITTYKVFANLGRCPANASVTVYSSPHPQASIINPAADTTICFGDSIKLIGNKVGAYAVWSPSNGLDNNSILAQMAKPTTSTTYTLTVTDTLYCPTPAFDSITVNVIPSFSVTAGNDTTAVVTEPLQLFASITDTSFKYPVTYKWTPTNFLNNPTLQNPVLTANSPAFDTFHITATTTDHHCVGTGKIFIRFFSTKPDIFVPSAFLPNGITPNRILIPTPVGIAHFEYFKVFNRWGQLVYSTTRVNEGWDGTIGGIIQNSGTYVYITQGVDYQKNIVTRKGTVVLIR